MKKHMRVHTQGKTFVCELCGKKFEESHESPHRRDLVTTVRASWEIQGLDVLAWDSASSPLATDDL